MGLSAPLLTSEIKERFFSDALLTRAIPRTGGRTWACAHDNPRQPGHRFFDRNSPKANHHDPPLARTIVYLCTT